jgi:hypothetical protein
MGSVCPAFHQHDQYIETGESLFVRRNVAAADIAAGSVRCENVNPVARTI